MERNASSCTNSLWRHCEVGENRVCVRNRVGFCVPTASISAGSGRETEIAGSIAKDRCSELWQERVVFEIVYDGLQFCCDCVTAGSGRSYCRCILNAVRNFAGNQNTFWSVAGCCAETLREFVLNFALQSGQSAVDMLVDCFKNRVALNFFFADVDRLIGSACCEFAWVEIVHHFCAKLVSSFAAVDCRVDFLLVHVETLADSGDFSDAVTLLVADVLDVDGRCFRLYFFAHVVR